MLLSVAGEAECTARIVHGYQFHAAFGKHIHRCTSTRFDVCHAIFQCGSSCYRTDFLIVDDQVVKVGKAR